MDHTHIIRNGKEFRQAIENMNAGDSLTLCLDQDIELTGSTLELKPETTLTIQSSDEAIHRTLYISQDDHHQIFFTVPSEGQTCIYLDHIILDGCRAASQKGCGQLLFLNEKSRLILCGNSTSIIRNFLLGKGTGLIHLDPNSKIEMSGMEIAENHIAECLGFGSRKGAVLYLCSKADAAITKCSFLKNGSGSRAGGVLYGERIGTLRISDAVFRENTTTEGACVGGALFVEIAKEITIRDSLFHSNYAAAAAAVYIEFSDVTITRTAISGHSDSPEYDSPYGAVLLCGKGRKQITDSKFTGNGTGEKVKKAGALYATGQVSVVNCIFKDNAAQNGSDIFWLPIDTRNDRLNLAGTRLCSLPSKGADSTIGLERKGDRSYIVFSY